MTSRPLPLLFAAALGFVVALGCIALWTPRPARAQFGSLGIGSQVPSGAQLPPQPLEVRPMDATHFVVATREPRLVSRTNGNGAALNMLVTVITYYTVRDDRLVPLEHVSVPAGYQQVKLSE